MAYPVDLDFQFDSTTASNECPVGLDWAEGRDDDPRPARWERVRTWTATLAAVAAAFLLPGIGSSLDQKCADMSAGSWFHGEYCQSHAPAGAAWASTPSFQSWSPGDLAATVPMAAPPMTPVARSLRPLR